MVLARLLLFAVHNSKRIVIGVTGSLADGHASLGGASILGAFGFGRGVLGDRRQHFCVVRLFSESSLTS